MRNLTELTNDAAVLAQRSGDADYLTKIKIWIQMTHKWLSEEYDFWNELQDIYNFSSVASQEGYPLPNNFDKPFRLYDLTNNKKIDPEVEEVYFDGNVANISGVVTAVPDKYRLYGVLGSRVAIVSTGTTLQVKSSSSADTGSIVVRVKGYIDSNLLILGYENITVSTGTPTTYVAGTTTFYKITHISKSANTTGYITIAQADNTVLETLASTERITRHKVLKLGKIPTGVYSYRLLYKKTVAEMVNDYDYPFVECDRFLVYDCAAWAYEQDKDSVRAGQLRQVAAQALMTILKNQNNKLGTDYQRKIINKWLTAHRTI